MTKHEHKMYERYQVCRLSKEVWDLVDHESLVSRRNDENVNSRLGRLRRNIWNFPLSRYNLWKRISALTNVKQRYCSFNKTRFGVIMGFLQNIFYSSGLQCLKMSSKLIEVAKWHFVAAFLSSPGRVVWRHSFGVQYIR